MPAKTKQKPAPSPSQNGFSLISNQKLIDLYTTMLKCRMLEERIRIFINKNGLTNSLAATCKEAAAAGAVIDLLPADSLSLSPRNLTLSFVKGVPLAAIFQSLANPTGYAPLSVLPPAPSTAIQIALATGVALADKMRQNNNITVAFLPRDLAAADQEQEALRFAATHRLPILYVVPGDEESEDISLKSNDYGLPCIPVDCHDVVAVYRVASEAITHARKSNGPTLIECKPYCLNTLPSDPILNMEKYLTAKGLFRPILRLEIAAAFARELNAATTAN